jgi:hypothetical protein
MWGTHVSSGGREGIQIRQGQICHFTWLGEPNEERKSRNPKNEEKTQSKKFV